MKNLIIRDGTSQQMRALAALQDGYFNLDEMHFSDLLAMATEFAGLVKFYNLENQEEGDWSPYFCADETIVISRILSTDLAAAGARFEHWWSQTFEHGSGVGDRGWRVQDLPVSPLANLINGWFIALESVSNDSGQKLRSLIAEVIEQLCSDKSSLTHFLVRAAIAGDGAGSIALHPLWSSSGRQAPAAPEKISKATVRSNFYAFVKAIEMIKKEALQRLPESLASQHHDPAIGLLIAFIRQFQKLKGKLNRFTRNYLDFYYDKVLKCTPLAPLADKTCLIVEINAPGREVRIARHTEFLAGLDADKRDIIYVSDDELIASDARVAALQTVFFDHNRYSSPENRLFDDLPPATVPEQPQAASQGLSWPTSAWLNPIALVAGSDYDAPDKLRAQPLFGAQKHANETCVFADARLGFILSSKVLLLKEGQRNVSVTLQFESGVLEQRIAALAAVMGDDNSQASAELQAIHCQDVFLKVFRHMFRIAYTGEQGWVEVPDYIPSHPDAKGGAGGYWLNIEFELAPEAAAVAPYDPLLHGERYDSAAPLLRFVLNSGAYLYPYGMLRRLPLAGAVIEVDVQGCRDLVLHNNIGQLSAAAPFAPFGPLPKIGSYLIVGGAEIAGKQLSSFGVDIEWADLPTVSGGFNTYYRGYERAVENSDFVVSAAVLSNGAWGPADVRGQPLMPLFRTMVRPGQGEKIGSHIRLGCDSIARYFHPAEAAPGVGPLEYSSSAKNGFFKFTLAAPAFAFGHEEYPNVLASTLIFNSRIKHAGRQRAVPNPPYTPQINAIAVRYKARASIRLDRNPADGPTRDDKFIHLYPSGWELLGPASSPAPTLLPQFDYSGNLYIGIEAVRLNGKITLFFHLREDSLPLKGQAELHWHYLSGNTWKALYKNNIVADGTEHFMTSGIVTLNMPSDIGGDNTVMPSGLYWLRLSADADLDKFCSVYSVHAQAVQVSRRHDVAATVPVILPAASIKRSKQAIPGVVKITQVIASVGGRPAERREQLRTRISERLRHKNRAVSAADYELLILQQFPEVCKVKCFANMATDLGPEQCVRPGRVLIVPLPYLSAVGRAYQASMLNGNVVREIQEFVETLASPWTTISVENPVYEHIQVRCTVKLKDGLGGGYYINRLNQDISDFLTPWNDACGYRAHFGWCVRQHDIEAFIIKLDYIDSVTGFSMLRISSVDAYSFSLFDTAAGGAGSQADSDIDSNITPLYPWSVAIPASRHVIDVVADFASAAPTRTALNQLEIGSTFIISPGEDDD